MTTTTQPQSISPRLSREEEILMEATQVFAKNGFRSTDVQDIADALRIGKGTVYRAFPTKEELFLACADKAMQRLQEAVKSQSAHLSDSLQQLKAGIKAYFQFFDENPELVELIIQERSEFKDRDKPTYFEHRDRNIQPWNELFARLIADGKVRAIKPEKITDFISHQLYGKLFTHYFTKKQQSLAEESDEVIDLLLHGFLLKPTKTKPSN